MFIFSSNVNVIHIEETQYDGKNYYKALVSFEKGGLERVSCPKDLPIGENELLFEFNNGKLKVL